jgi:para-nitrobenzyl esterase
MKLLLKRFSAALALCISLTAGAAEAAQPTSVLKIGSGPLRGLDDGEMLSYRGIPYAAPPVGDLRWRPPQAPRSWTETRDATETGSACVQNPDLGAFATPGGSEDCLYLNVYAPRAAVQAGRPLRVFVWIHGGSLWVGQGSDYDPRKLVLDGQAVVVTLNYRLGMFGFFAHPAIDGEGHAFANYGQMDQSFALDWVQRNIEAFGGDPTNVTIAGESSGGTSVLAQVISPWSAGKFQHAIDMSGSSLIIRYPNFGAARPLDVARKVGSDFATAAGCDDQSAHCLRRLTVGQILAIQKSYMINQTIIDGDFMPVHPAEALRSGRFNRVTLINGTTRDEGRFFVGFPENETGLPLTEQGYPAALEAFFGANLAPRVREEYPVDDYNSPSEAYAAAATDYLFSCPALMVNRWASQATTVYAYEFADRTAPSYLKPTTFPLGAAHTYELPYLFPGFRGGTAGIPVTLNPLQEKLSDEMVRYWTSASGASQWKDWPRYAPDQQNVLRLMLPQSQVLRAGRFTKDHHCGFWDQAGIY